MSASKRQVKTPEAQSKISQSSLAGKVSVQVLINIPSTYELQTSEQAGELVNLQANWFNWLDTENGRSLTCKTAKSVNMACQAGV